MKKRLVAMLLVLGVMFAMVACGEVKATPTPTTAPTTAPETTKTPDVTEGPAATATPIPATTDVAGLKFTAGTVLRMACGYNNTKTGISFTPDVLTSKVAPDGTLTLANGKTYSVGMLKPTWERVEQVLGMKFEDLWTGAGSASKEFDYWKEKLDQVDMVAGSAATLSEYGAAGELVNLADYLDIMPNFKAYLEANPIVRLSITGDTKTGAIYFSPYFDGVNDIERMPLMRTDWVEKLLNGEGDFTAAACANLAAAAYTPYMPTSGKVAVDVVKLDGSAVESINKDYDKAGNIVKNMNDALAKGTVTGVEAVNMLRKYIDEAYNGYYGTDRANLFIGQNAAWDADELVALLRCVVANAQTLNGTDTVYGLFSREDDNTQRRVDMFRFAGTLFGVRGLESRSDCLYFDSEGNLHDARQEEATYEAMEKMNAMAKEGLISATFINTEAAGSKTLLAEDAGFMSYDYNQTQTAYNQTQLQEGEKYMAVMVPVARWNDGTGEKVMRFTESWRSVKTDGWAISKKGVGTDENKLKAALSLIDYAYSPEGQILMSYGPDEFIKKDSDGNYVTFNFNGNQMPVIADATYEELWKLESGNYTNYARFYLGSTLSFAKSQAFEYQCTQAVGKEGASKISTAIALGTIKHPELAICDNMWYTSVPTVLPNTTEENKTLKTYTGLTDKFSTSKGGVNILVDQIANGYTTYSSAAATATAVKNDMSGTAYLDLKQTAWKRLSAYFKTLTK